MIVTDTKGDIMPTDEMKKEVEKFECFLRGSAYAAGILLGSATVVAILYYVGGQ